MNKIFDRLFSHPNFTCDVCSCEIFGKERLCKSCLQALPRNNGEICLCCGRAELQTGLCIECRAHRPDFDMARSAFEYEGSAASMILRLKDGQRYLAETLAEFLLPLLEDYADADALCYVPMTRSSEEERGYNQAELLAKHLSDWSEIEVLHCVKKSKETESQKTLNYQKRKSNLKGVFRVEDKKKIQGKNVVVIDDVLTTGATANELARCLKKAGANRVYVLTVASVPNKINT